MSGFKGLRTDLEQALTSLYAVAFSGVSRTTGAGRSDEHFPHNPNYKPNPNSNPKTNPTNRNVTHPTLTLTLSLLTPLLTLTLTEQGRGNDRGGIVQGELPVSRKLDALPVTQPTVWKKSKQ